MNFSEQTFDELAPYEPYFRTAVESNWCRYPGRVGLQRMQDELDRIDGHKTLANFSCSSCNLTIVRRVGRMWFADQKERAEAAAAKALNVPKKTTAKSKKK